MFRTSIIVILLVLLSTAVRIYHIGERGLTPDESLTLCRINGWSATFDGESHIADSLNPVFSHQEIRSHKTYDHVVDATIHDSGNAIAYNLLLAGWTQIFGDSNTSMRMMTAVFGILTVILGYYFCRQLFNERTANIAGVLLSLHPVLIDFSQMARGYVPATFLILLSTYSLYQVAVSKMHTWLHIPLYIISLILSLLSHYVTLYVFISHIFLVAIFHSHRKALMQYAVMALFGFGLFSVWLLNGGWEGKKLMNIERSMWQMNVSVNGQEPSHVESAVMSFVQLGKNLVNIFGYEHIAEYNQHSAILILLLLPAGVVFFVYLKVRKSEYFRPVMFVTFPLATYIIYVLAMILRTGHTIPFDIRYATFVMPFACLLLAFGADRMIAPGGQRRTIGWVLTSALCGIMLAGVFSPEHAVSEHRDEFVYHHAARFVMSNAAPGDTLVFSQKENAVFTNFYLPAQVSMPQRIDLGLKKETLQLRNGSRNIGYIFE